MERNGFTPQIRSHLQVGRLATKRAKGQRCQAHKQSGMSAKSSAAALEVEGIKVTIPIKHKAVRSLALACP